MFVPQADFDFSAKNFEFLKNQKANDFEDFQNSKIQKSSFKDELEKIQDENLNSVQKPKNQKIQDKENHEKIEKNLSQNQKLEKIETAKDDFQKLKSEKNALKKSKITEKKSEKYDFKSEKKAKNLSKSEKKIKSNAQNKKNEFFALSDFRFEKNQNDTPEISFDLNLKTNFSGEKKTFPKNLQKDFNADFPKEKILDFQNLEGQENFAFFDLGKNFSEKNLNEKKNFKNVQSPKIKKIGKFEIQDFRNEKIGNQINFQKIKAQEKNSPDFFKEDGKNLLQNQFISEFISHSNVEQNILSFSDQAASANGSNFQSMLSSAILKNAPEFVRAGNLVLRDGGKGNINLILHPENLGNVKVSLALSGKEISAEIFVHSKEAFEAFRENLGALKEAFSQSGFETGAFDLNFSDSSFSGQNFFGENSSQHRDADFLSAKIYGDYVLLNDTQENSENFFVNGTDFAVNIVA